ncbi:MAG: hypothetical protein KAR06_09260, partial [Deltaproteobacteria bacterium]|nr:hypothetical protein [Deltaproteobacteria bacterium]
MSRYLTYIFIMIVVILLPVLSAASDIKDIYIEKCSWCHGNEGKGDGPASKFLRPAPRDLTEGV